MRRTMTQKIICLVVATLFLFNDLCYGLSPMLGSTNSGTKADMNATGNKWFSAKYGPGAINFEVPNLKRKFVGSDIVHESTVPGSYDTARDIKEINDYQTKFARVHYKKPPKGWKNNPVLEQTDLVKAFEMFRDTATRIPADQLEIKEGWFPVNEDAGELPIARIEPMPNGKYVLILHTKFVQMWNQIRAKDIWFKANMGKHNRRTISVAWGIFYRIAKHEMEELSKRNKDVKSYGHAHYGIIYGQQGVGLGISPQRDEETANTIGGNYALFNDAIWMWFLGSYCFADTTRYNNDTFYQRMSWFFSDDPIAKQLELNLEFPNLNKDPHKQYIAKAFAHQINKNFFSRKNMQHGIKDSSIVANSKYMKNYSKHVEDYYKREAARKDANITEAPLYATGEDSVTEAKPVTLRLNEEVIITAKGKEIKLKFYEVHSRAQIQVSLECGFIVLRRDIFNEIIAIENEKERNKAFDSYKEKIGGHLVFGMRESPSYPGDDLLIFAGDNISDAIQVKINKLKPVSRGVRKFLSSRRSPSRFSRLSSAEFQIIGPEGISIDSPAPMSAKSNVTFSGGQDASVIAELAISDAEEKVAGLIMAQGNRCPAFLTVVDVLKKANSKEKLDKIADLLIEKLEEEGNIDKNFTFTFVIEHMAKKYVKTDKHFLIYDGRKVALYNLANRQEKVLFEEYRDIRYEASFEYLYMNAEYAVIQYEEGERGDSHSSERTYVYMLIHNLKTGEEKKVVCTKVRNQPFQDAEMIGNIIIGKATIEEAEDVMGRYETGAVYGWVSINLMTGERKVHRGLSRDDVITSYLSLFIQTLAKNSKNMDDLLILLKARLGETMRVDPRLTKEYIQGLLEEIKMREIDSRKLSPDAIRGLVQDSFDKWLGNWIKQDEAERKKLKAQHPALEYRYEVSKRYEYSYPRDRYTEMNLKEFYEIRESAIKAIVELQLETRQEVDALINVILNSIQKDSKWYADYYMNEYQTRIYKHTLSHMDLSGVAFWLDNKNNLKGLEAMIGACVGTDNIRDTTYLRIPQILHALKEALNKAISKSKYFPVREVLDIAIAQEREAQTPQTIPTTFSSGQDASVIAELAISDAEEKVAGLIMAQGNRCPAFLTVVDVLRKANREEKLDKIADLLIEKLEEEGNIDKNFTPAFIAEHMAVVIHAQAEDMAEFARHNPANDIAERIFNADDSLETFLKAIEALSDNRPKADKVITLLIGRLGKEKPKDQRLTLEVVASKKIKKSIIVHDTFTTSPPSTPSPYIDRLEKYRLRVMSRCPVEESDFQKILMEEADIFDEIILPVGPWNRRDDDPDLIFVFTGKEGVVDNIVQIDLGRPKGAVQGITVMDMDEFIALVSKELSIIDQKYEKQVSLAMQFLEEFKTRAKPGDVMGNGKNEKALGEYALDSVNSAGDVVKLILGERNGRSVLLAIMSALKNTNEQKLDDVIKLLTEKLIDPATEVADKKLNMKFVTEQATLVNPLYSEKISQYRYDCVMKSWRANTIIYKSNLGYKIVEFVPNCGSTTSEVFIVDSNKKVTGHIICKSHVIFLKVSPKRRYFVVLEPDKRCILVYDVKNSKTPVAKESITIDPKKYGLDDVFHYFLRTKNFVEFNKDESVVTFVEIKKSEERTSVAIKKIMEPSSTPGVEKNQAESTHAQEKVAAEEARPVNEIPGEYKHFFDIISTYVIKVGPYEGPGSAPLSLEQTIDLYKTIDLLHEGQIEIYAPQGFKFTEDMIKALKGIGKRQGHESVRLCSYSGESHLLGFLQRPAAPGVKRIVLSEDKMRKNMLDLVNRHAEDFRYVRLLSVALPEGYQNMERDLKTIHQAKMMTIAILARLFEKDKTPVVEALLQPMLKECLDLENEDVAEFMNELGMSDERVANLDANDILSRVTRMLGRSVKLVEKIGQEIHLMKAFWMAA